MDSKIIGRKLINLRGSKTREEVASDLNLSVSAIGMYEQGNRVPKDEIKILLAHYYGTTVQELFFEM